MNAQTHTVPELKEPLRLQEYGVGIFELIPTKSALKKAIKKGWITVNNQPATTATFIKGGEQITLTPSYKNLIHKQVNIKLNVLFQDDYLAAIDKPTGIPVSGYRKLTIANALPHNLTPSTQPDATTPQPVHRLDKPTTGVLLVGKTSSSIRALNHEFEQRTIQKTYYAVTIGEMPANGIVELPVDDKNALTHYRVIQSVKSERFKMLNLVELTPKTGRRHQLRQHMASLGNPILGDKEYFIPKLILVGKGLYLHAASLELEHPITKNKLVLNAALPKNFTDIFNTELPH